MKKTLILLISLVTVATMMHVARAGIEVDTPGGPGCCPVLYVFNGSGFEFTGVLPLANGTDTTRLYELTVTPEPFYGFYVMQLREEDESVSYIDQVNLIVDQNVLSVIGTYSLLFSDDYHLILEPGDSTIMLFPAVPGDSFKIQIEGHFS